MANSSIDSQNIVEDIQNPFGTINSKLTVHTLYGKRCGRIAEVYLQATANSNIGGWEYLLGNANTRLRPYESNNAYTMTVGSSAVMCNLNQDGTLNTATQIPANANVRFKANYMCEN